jgi:putative SOS response-associated peptidase YedK
MNRIGGRLGCRREWRQYAPFEIFRAFTNFRGMCYNAESATLAQLKYAIHRGDQEWAEELARKLHQLDPTRFPYFHVSGYAHPKLLVFTDDKPYEPQMMTWGFIPYWAKSAEDAKKLYNQTLNARGETIFEKPAFRASAKSRRCLIYLDAFYEHHHANKRTYPFRIFSSDSTPLAVAGLWDEWVDKETGEVLRTVTIVTTTGNALMSRIHNNPKAEMGPRMPVILPRGRQNDWLIPCKNDEDKKRLRALIKPYEGELKAYPVAQLIGKNAVGNVPKARNEVLYEELADLLTVA